MSNTDFETAISHFGDAVGSFFKGFVHTVAVIAPLVSEVAKATGSSSVANEKNLKDFSNVANEVADVSSNHYNQV